MDSLLETPEGFVWLFDRLTLETLPPLERAQWREFHEEVWDHLISDPSVHEGCAPADELRRVEFDLQRTIEEHGQELDDARDDGYRQACTDIGARIQAMQLDGEAAAARDRILAGVAKLRERGPAPETDPEPAPLVAA